MDINLPSLTPLLNAALAITGITLGAIIITGIVAWLKRNFK